MKLYPLPVALPKEIIMYVLTLAPGVTLHVDESIAWSLRHQLAAGATEAQDPEREDGSEGRRTARVLGDDHPYWERHTGLEGHRGQEWEPADSAQAEAFYAVIAGKARVFIDLLIDHPGQLLAVDDICRLRPDDFSGSRSIAGALNGLRTAHLASGRRYPFYWWAGSPTHYGMKPLVAALFGQARHRIGG
jgi:hypothetical protein